MCKLTCAAIIFPAIFAVAQQSSAHHAAHSGYVALPAQSADEIWWQLMEGNRRFVTGRMKPEHVVSDRKSLINEQPPKVMTFSCSDSRVPPDVICDQQLGTLSKCERLGILQAHSGSLVSNTPSIIWALLSLSY